MREILFRGKTFDGEWEEGSLHIEYGETTADGKRNLDYRILGMRGECRYVDPETVGQYTGLCDKNGKKIFEGDIVNISWHAPRRETVYEKHEVVYSKSGFFTKRNGKLMGQISNYIAQNVNMRCEVIGNIHDNPELLEVDNGT